MTTGVYVVYVFITILAFITNIMPILTHGWISGKINGILSGLGLSFILLCVKGYGSYTVRNQMENYIFAYFIALFGTYIMIRLLIVALISYAKSEKEDF